MSTGDAAAQSLAQASRRAFSETSDPDAYVERAATANALAAIEAWLDADALGSTVAAIVGTPGIGKTMLLRVVAARLFDTPPLLAGTLAAAHARALYVPHPGLTPVDLATWVHAQLGRPCPALPDAAAAGTALLALGGSLPLVLLVDDADAMPPETTQMFIQRLPALQSPVRLLLALNPDSRGSRLLASFHALRPKEVRFRERMSIGETASYLRARMRWAGFPTQVIAEVDLAEAQRLHSLSNGVPRALHAIASARFDPTSQLHGEVTPTRERRPEDWMGRPIGDDLDL